MRREGRVWDGPTFRVPFLIFSIQPTPPHKSGQVARTSLGFAKTKENYRRGRDFFLTVYFPRLSPTTVKAPGAIKLQGWFAEHQFAHHYFFTLTKTVSAHLSGNLILPSELLSTNVLVPFSKRTISPGWVVWSRQHSPGAQRRQSGWTCIFSIHWPARRGWRVVFCEVSPAGKAAAKPSYSKSVAVNCWTTLPTTSPIPSATHTTTHLPATNSDRASKLIQRKKNLSPAEKPISLPPPPAPRMGSVSTFLHKAWLASSINPLFLFLSNLYNPGSSRNYLK